MIIWWEELEHMGPKYLNGKKKLKAGYIKETLGSMYKFDPVKW